MDAPVTCRYCPREIPPENLDRERGIGRCDHCQTLVDVSAQLLPPRARQDAPRALPVGIDVVHRPSGLELAVHHGARDRLDLTDLVILAGLGWLVWTFVMDGGVALAVLRRSPDLVETLLEHPEALLELLAVVGGPVVGLLGFLIRHPSRTRVMATPDELVVRRSLLPWLGTVAFRVGDIDQLYSRQKPFEKTALAPGEGGVATVEATTYELRVRLKDQSDRLVVDGLWRPEQPLFLEQRLEEYLGLPDRPVALELDR